MSQRRLRRSRGEALALAADFAWCAPKHWRQILGDTVAGELRALTEQIVDEDGWQIVAKEIMPDQVQTFMCFGLAEMPMLISQTYTSCTGQIVRQRFPQPRNHAKVSWSPSYLADTVAYASGSTKRCAANQSDAAALS